MTYFSLDTPCNLKCKQDLLKQISAKCWKDPMEALGGGVTHYAVSNHYFLGAAVQVGYVKNLVSLSKKYVFSIKVLHDMSVTYLQSVEKIQWKL